MTMTMVIWSSMATKQVKITRLVPLCHTPRYLSKRFITFLTSFTSYSFSGFQRLLKAVFMGRCKVQFNSLRLSSASKVATRENIFIHKIPFPVSRRVQLLTAPLRIFVLNWLQQGVSTKSSVLLNILGLLEFGWNQYLEDFNNKII